MPPTFRTGDCSHIWAESDYVELNAAVDYWCEGDARCRLAKQQAILSACERGLVKWTRADGKTFDDPVRELAGRNLVLIERQSFETWAAAVDEKISLPPSMSTREANSLRRQVGALVLLLAQRDKRYRKEDGTPSANAIAEDVETLLNDMDRQRAIDQKTKLNRAGVSVSNLRQNIPACVQELFG